MAVMILSKNACLCTLDGSPADRVTFGYLCQANPNHWVDASVGLVAGAFNNSTPPTSGVFDSEALEERSH